VKLDFDSEELLRLFFFQRVDGNAGPARDHVFNVVARHFRGDERVFLVHAEARRIAVRSRPFIQLVPVSQIALFASHAELHARAGFVDYVDCFVRQETIWNVTV